MLGPKRSSNRRINPRCHERSDDGKQAVVVNAFIVEERQHQRAGKAEFGGATGQGDRVRNRRGAGADEHAITRQAALRIGPHHPQPLRQRK